MDANDYVIGIDGGGTHSFAVAVTREGRILASSRSGSLNFFGTALPEVRRHLNELVRSIEVEVPLGARRIGAVVGSAALNEEATEEQRVRLCQGILPLEELRVVSDGQTAYAGICLNHPGVLVISGTGSIVLARSESGRFVHVGGWGHLIGDEGGAYWIAIQALRAAVAAFEGRGPSTGLVRAAVRWSEVKELGDIVSRLYQPAFGKDRIAALALRFNEDPGPDDPVFREILERAGVELADQAMAAASAARVLCRPLPLHLNGAVVLRNQVVQRSLIRRIRTRCEVEVRPSVLTPTLGAAALALEAVGVTLDEAVVANLGAGVTSVGRVPPEGRDRDSSASTPSQPSP